MAESQVSIATIHAARYKSQLCKHWGHRLEIEEDETGAVVRLPEALLTMRADDTALHVTLRAGNAQGLEAMKHVMTSHLDRFAFREAPFAYHWNDG